jgi:hypothetical protein
VLERVFADRQVATEAAVAPIYGWCETGTDAKCLRIALTRAMEGYMAFLRRLSRALAAVTSEEIENISAAMAALAVRLDREVAEWSCRLC